MSPSARACPVLIVLASACGPAGECLVGDVDESAYCGDDGADCVELGELSKHCIGSHTEQPCTLRGVTYVRVGGDDAATLFFHEDGSLAAVRSVGEGTDTCADAWFGLDLTDCTAAGDEQVVECDGNGMGE